MTALLHHARGEPTEPLASLPHPPLLLALRGLRRALSEFVAMALGEEEAMVGLRELFRVSSCSGWWFLCVPGEEALVEHIVGGGSVALVE